MKMRTFLALAAVLCLLLCGCTQGAESGGSETSGSGKDNISADRWENLLSYEEYLEKTAAERSAFAESFEDPADFKAWLKAAKETYESQQQDEGIGNDGVIDMEKIDP